MSRICQTWSRDREGSQSRSESPRREGWEVDAGAGDFEEELEDQRREGMMGTSGWEKRKGGGKGQSFWSELEHLEGAPL